MEVLLPLRCYLTATQPFHLLQTSMKYAEVYCMGRIQMQRQNKVTIWHALLRYPEQNQSEYLVLITSLLYLFGYTLHFELLSWPQFTYEYWIVRVAYKSKNL